MGDLLNKTLEGASEFRDRGKNKQDNSFYTGARVQIRLEADSQQQPLELIVYLNPKKDIVGVELAGCVLPYSWAYADKSKLDNLRYVYQRGKQAIIKNMHLFAPKG